jgi:hypothetical protein
MRVTRVVALAALLFWCAGPVSAQAVKLEFHDGRVNLTTQNASLRAILNEWARLGGTQVVNAERLTGAPVTLQLTDVPEMQALDIILRGVSGFALAARTEGTPGASMYDRIMILPTSVAPRNPPPATSPVFQGVPPGMIRPPVMRGNEDANVDDDNPGQVNDGVPLGRPIPVPRPVVGGSPFAAPIPPGVVMPPITVAPPDDQPQPQQPAGVVPTPGNPFGLPAGSSTRPGVITPVPQAPQPGATTRHPD